MNDSLSSDELPHDASSRLDRAIKVAVAVYYAHAFAHRAEAAMPPAEIVVDTVTRMAPESAQHLARDLAFTVDSACRDFLATPD